MLQLTMRGTTVTVMATVEPVAGGCAAVLSAQAPRPGRRWSRLLRWSEAAWIGTAADGGTVISFYQHEGRLPGDSLTVRPADAAAFQAALARVVSGCRAERRESERVLMASQPASRACYFARLPSLHLVDQPAADPPRAVLTILSRENPQAELQLVIERSARDTTAKSDDWGRPAVAFTFADPRLADMRIAAAEFALDAKPVAAEHTLTTFSETRLRIGMDRFRASGGSKRQDSFYRRLTTSGEVTLTLLDGTAQVRAVLNFDAGPALTSAREALTAVEWSCAGASPAPEPAAKWRPQSEGAR